MKETFNDATQYQSSISGSGDFPVKFFQLNPGEQAIVRILVDSDEDLCAYGFHEIQTPDNKIKRVNCIRSLREDINKCPLCANNVKFDQLIYIHLLQYYPDGRIEAKTWGRKPPVGNKGTSVIDQIRKALATYGGLSNYVTSITRTGSGLDTSYSINVNLPENIYPAASFPLDTSAFEDYSEEGTILKNWTAEEMNTYLTTGKLPETSNNNSTASVPFNTNNAQPAYQPVQNQQVFQQTAGTQQTINNGAPFNTNASDLPFANSQPAVDRPVRRYN